MDITKIGIVFLSISVLVSFGFSSNQAFAGEPNLDFGDAPDIYGTLLASDGARHASDGTIFLGAAPDLESDGIPTANADGDDNDNTDDEDGLVSITALEQGETYTTTFSHSGGGVLGLWIDYNQNGQFENDIGSPERLIVGGFFQNPGTVSFDRTVPCDAIVGDTYMRWRFSLDFPFGPTGFASDGEVEDYKITILPSPPSSTCPPPPATVGGEMLPLDTTSLLLAGAQTFSWMIPVVLSVLGIGLFVVSRKSENS